MVGDGVPALCGASFFVESYGEALVDAGFEDGRGGADAGSEHGHDGVCECGGNGNHFGG